MKLALDVMGGDHAPKAHIHAVMKAVKTYPDIEFILVGDEEGIKPHLVDDTRITIIHTTEKIDDSDSPTTAVRRKKGSSMVLAVKEVKEGRADACISAGNTGALMTAGLLHIGRISGIDRPALAPVVPTADGNGFLLIDAGANMDAKPNHLLQCALIGNIYMNKVRKVKQPRVGLLNVGAEAGKGNDLTKRAFSLLEEAPLHFVGNVESRDLLNGIVDVVVCDGFSGNLVLKSMEGAAGTFFSVLKNELKTSIKSKLAALVLKPSFRSAKEHMSYSAYGGAGLFGLNAPVIKAHGSSDETALFNAIRQAREMVQQEVVQTIGRDIQAVASETSSVE